MLGLWGGYADVILRAALLVICVVLISLNLAWWSLPVFGSGIWWVPWVVGAAYVALIVLVSRWLRRHVQAQNVEWALGGRQ